MNKYIEVAAYESPMSHLVAGVLGAGLEEGEEEVVGRGKWDGRCPEDTFFDVLPLTTMRSSSDYPICQTGNLSYLYLFIFDVFQPIWHLWFYSLWGKQGKGCSAHVGQGSAMMRTQSPCLVFFKTLPPGAGLGLKPMQFWVPSLRERIQKYLMFANITKTHHHVNTWLGPLLRPSEGVMWATGPWMLRLSSTVPVSLQPRPTALPATSPVLGTPLPLRKRLTCWLNWCEIFWHQVKICFWKLSITPRRSSYSKKQSVKRQVPDSVEREAAPILPRAWCMNWLDPSLSPVLHQHCEIVRKLK